MYSKLAKWKQLNSITVRLTFFYSVATFILLFVIGLFLYGTTVHVLHRANNQFLSHEIVILKKLLKNQSKNRLALEQKVVEIPNAETGSAYHYFVRILDEKNNVVLQTPGIKKVLKNNRFLNRKAKLVNDKLKRWSGDGYTQYVLMQSPVHFGPSHQSGLIQIALDVSYQQQMLKQYQVILLMVLLLGFLFAILVGYIIAQRGLRSVSELTSTTKTISASSLHQRLDPEFWPKELKTLGMAFNQMLDRIETSFAYLTEFSADLAHELRTPVNNLMGETEIALTRDYSVEEYQQVLVSNLEELRRISQIIENLLFLARADNLQLDIKKESLAVGREIQRICDYYQALADEKNISISLQGDALVHANPVMFSRIISNLLSNAIKYTPNDGSIKIIVSKVVDTVHITLKDNGMGIAAEHLPKIFNRFYRVDAARSHRSGGVGLGLAIVKSIVELHRGTISIMSETGRGTSVRLILPVR